MSNRQKGLKYNQIILYLIKIIVQIRGHILLIKIVWNILILLMDGFKCIRKEKGLAIRATEIFWHAVLKA